MKWLSALFLAVMLPACDRSEPVTWQDIQGNKVQLINNQSKWLVINYWANWCKPCFEEIPQLNALYQAHRKNADVVVAGVSFDRLPKEILKQQVIKAGITYPVLSADPAKYLGIKEIPTLPATFIIAPNGKVMNILFGKQTQASLEEALVAARKLNKG